MRISCFARDQELKAIEREDHIVNTICTLDLQGGKPSSLEGGSFAEQAEGICCHWTKLGCSFPSCGFVGTEGRGHSTSGEELLDPKGSEEPFCPLVGLSLLADVVVQRRALLDLAPSPGITGSSAGDGGDHPTDVRHYTVQRESFSTVYWRHIRHSSNRTIVGTCARRSMSTAVSHGHDRT
jgi:hypothetical protein